MRRLYLQIYGTVVASLILFGVLSWVFWTWFRPIGDEDRYAERLGEVLAMVLPGPEKPENELQAALEHWTRGLSERVSVRAPDGRLLAAVGEPLPPPPGPPNEGRGRRHRPGFGWTVALPDGRTMQFRHDYDPSPLVPLVQLLTLAGAIALVAYPVVRRLTRRLEALQLRVEALGAGDLSARVDVRGHDEVADLATSFNRAAARIEVLVQAQQRLLASVSHELRSPLTRIRMATELLPAAERPDLRARIGRDIEELDALIGELLLASRLEADAGAEPAEDVDLLAIVAEESARLPELAVALDGVPTPFRGSPRLLRRLVRNLLENARRHAAGAPIEVHITPAAGGLRLEVCDGGPGVPESERERIFEPFYRAPGARETDGGVGLGLSLARQIARHHGGDVRCHARAGGGTRFEVTLTEGSAKLLA